MTGVTFVCRSDNDLYRVLADLGLDLPRYDGLSEALGAVPPGGGVLALADDYPRPAPPFDETLADLVASKNLRRYLEYPAPLPGMSLSEPRPTRWERVVVSSDFFLPQLEPSPLWLSTVVGFYPSSLPLSRRPGSQVKAASLPLLTRRGKKDSP
jgi:hypothetical protein